MVTTYQCVGVSHLCGIGVERCIDHAGAMTMLGAAAAGERVEVLSGNCVISDAALTERTPMERAMGKFSSYEYRKQPGFDMNAFGGASQAIPMKTLVIYCFDPRAAEVPEAVAAHFGDEVYPGENIIDENGVRVGSTRTLFTATNAGGRAAFALESVAAMDYLFNVKNVVVVHHSFCGTTTLTPELIVEEFRDHHHADIAALFDHDSLAIMDFEESLNYDIKLLRESPAVPKHVKLYGFFYEISSGKLIEVVRDIPA